MTLMDAVDQKQQQEIESTKTWTKIISVVLTLLMLSSIGLFAMMMESRNCPHQECPHHTHKK